MLEFYSNKMLKKNNVSVLFFTRIRIMVNCSILFATFMNRTVRGVNNPRELETFHEDQSTKVILSCPQCHMISTHIMQRINTSLVISNHSKKKSIVRPLLHQKEISCDRGRAACSEAVRPQECRDGLRPPDAGP